MVCIRWSWAAFIVFVLCVDGEITGGIVASQSVRQAPAQNRTVPAFEDNMYANLLMRAVTGSLYPEETFSASFVDSSFPRQVFISVELLVKLHAQRDWQTKCVETLFSQAACMEPFL